MKGGWRQEKEEERRGMEVASGAGSAAPSCPLTNWPPVAPHARVADTRAVPHVPLSMKHSPPPLALWGGREGWREQEKPPLYNKFLDKC